MPQRQKCCTVSKYIWLSFICAHCVPSGSLLAPSNLLVSICTVMYRCIAGLFVSHPVNTIFSVHHMSPEIYITMLLFLSGIYSVYVEGGYVHYFRYIDQAKPRPL